MRDYTGPTPPRPTPMPRTPQPKEQWVELNEDEPCKTCGEYLIAPATVRRMAGGRDAMFVGAGLCRNGH